MKIQKVEISKKLTVVLEDNEITLLIDVLNMSVLRNRLTCVNDKLAKDMIDKLKEWSP